MNSPPADLGELVDGVGSMAKAFASKFVDEARDEWSNVKSMVNVSGSKLGDMLNDIQHRYG